MENECCAHYAAVLQPFTIYHVSLPELLIFLLEDTQAQQAFQPIYTTFTSQLPILLDHFNNHPAGSGWSQDQHKHVANTQACQDHMSRIYKNCE